VFFYLLRENRAPDFLHSGLLVRSSSPLKSGDSILHTPISACSFFKQSIAMDPSVQGPHIQGVVPMLLATARFKISQGDPSSALQAVCPSSKRCLSSASSVKEWIP
jgi:hypothetical protein